MVDNDNFEQIMNIFNKVCYVIAAITCIAVGLLFIYIGIKSDELAIKLIVLPFSLAFIFAGGKVFSIVIDNNKLKYIFDISYVVAALLYWFMFLIFMTYSFIVDKEFIKILILVPFYLFGIIIGYLVFKKGKNEKYFR